MLRFQGITSQKASLALALMSLAVGVTPSGLAAIGYQLSPVQGYVVLAFAALLFVGAGVVLVWPYASSQKALDKYLKQMQGWVGDTSNPLASLPPEHPRRKLAIAETLRALEGLSPRDKGDVLRFLYKQGLMFRGNTVVSLNHADLSNARLANIELSNANLIQANLKSANLTHAKLYEVSVYAEAKAEAKREGVPAHNFVHFAGCELRDAILKGAKLKNAGLAGCDFDSADLEGANLDCADLRAADLGRARNLTQKHIERAYGSYRREWVKDTKLPKGLEPPPAWSKPIHEQKRERARRETAQLERAHAGP